MGLHLALALTLRSTVSLCPALRAMRACACACARAKTLLTMAILTTWRAVSRHRGSPHFGYITAHLVLTITWTAVSHSWLVSCRLVHEPRSPAAPCAAFPWFPCLGLGLGLELELGLGLG